MFEMLGQSYVDLSQSLLDATGMSHEMAHLHAGLALYLIGQFVFRDRRGAVRALQLVLVAELANEALQICAYGSLRLADTAQDIILTLFWPVAVYGMSIYRRHRWSVMMARLEVELRTNPLEAQKRQSATS